MSSTMTLKQLGQRIEHEQAGKKDMIVDTRNLELGNDNMLYISQGEYDHGRRDFFNPNAHCHAQMATALGIPKRYYDRMRAEDPTLLAQNVNNWLHDNPSTQMLRTMHGTARAFLSDRYRRLDNIDLLTHIFPIFADIPDLRFHQAAMTDERLYLRVITPRLTQEIAKGDAVSCGIEISNSEVGSGALQIKSFLLRLICMNGMTMEVALRKTHLGKRIDDTTIYRDETVEADDKAFFLQVRDVVENALSEARFEQLISQLKDAASTDLLQNVIAATTTLAQKHSLTEGETSSILNHLITGGDLSLWGFANAVTDAADESEEFGRQAELEALGGALVNDLTYWKELVAA